MTRPKINIEKKWFEKVIEILTFGLFILSAIVIGIYYSDLPEKLPIYFNWPRKDENGLGTKDLLWVSPITFGIIGLVIYRLNKSPWIFNYPTEINEKNAERNYKYATQMLRILGFTIGIVCLSLTLSSISNGLGNNTDFDKYLYPLLPIILILVPIVCIVKMITDKKTMHNNGYK